jgi:hypothetical protein
MKLLSSCSSHRLLAGLNFALLEQKKNIKRFFSFTQKQGEERERESE